MSDDGTRSTPDVCAWSETATLHVLGALAEGEAARFAEHLRACSACAREVEAAATDIAQADLAFAEEQAPMLAPASNSVRERLLRAAADERRATELEQRGLDRSWLAWDAERPQGASTEGFTRGMYAIASDAGEWRSVGLPGIEVKRLAADPERRTATMLVRMAPGSKYPAHRHGGVEECLVLSGDLVVGDRPMRAGDYQLAEKGSVHPVQTTRGGCMLYIASSQDDELIDELAEAR